MGRPNSAKFSSKKTPRYFRRCHLCGSLTESGDDHVERCACCHTAFARFQYFDDKYTPTVGDNVLRPVYTRAEFEPLQGLTVYWEPF